MEVVAMKTSGMHNRRVRWLKYIEDKKKVEAEGRPLSPLPPSRRDGVKHNAKPLVELIPTRLNQVAQAQSKIRS